MKKVEYIAKKALAATLAGVIMINTPAISFASTTQRDTIVNSNDCSRHS